MTRHRIILQARTSSTRLPGKVLLPIAGIPLALLCAKRLSCKGVDLVLATSQEPSDDLLVELASEQRIAVVRGSLGDVASRFLEASADLDDDDLIIRATADNPVPDGDLVESAVADFQEAGGNYLGPTSYRRDLPYGLMVEVCRLGALRRSLENCFQPDVREHVTSVLAAGGSLIERSRFVPDGDLPLVRLTVDTLDDYLIAARAFGTGEAAASAPWRTLVSQFAALCAVETR